MDGPANIETVEGVRSREQVQLKAIELAARSSRLAANIVKVWFWILIYFDQ